MPRLLLFLLSIALLAGCGGDRPRPGRFVTDILLPYTPVGDQAGTTLCWLYAMLSTIETDRIVQGDSVHLSTDFLARHVLEERIREAFLTRRPRRLNLRGTALDALDALGRYGVVGYDAYHGNAPTREMLGAVRQVISRQINGRAGLDRLDSHVQSVLGQRLAPPPEHVWLYGASYTPHEFARSVCPPGAYTAYTSFTHHPFGRPCVLELPDNTDRHEALNVPLDEFLDRIDSALAHGRSVCWEGTIHTESFDAAAAVGDAGTEEITQAERQKSFESFRTTDDHCMQIIGRAHDTRGRTFYILKNSWGESGPYRGLTYLSRSYIEMFTVLAVMRN